MGKGGYKCELCHRRYAKHQHFEPDGRELYVCGICRNRRWAAFAPELLAVLEKTFPECVERFKVSERNKGEKQDRRLCNAIAIKLLQIKSRFRKNTNVLMMRPESLPTGQSVGAFAMFLPSERRISLNYMVMEDENTVLSQFEWNFDASDPENGIDCSVKWKFSMNGEETEQEYGIGNIPFEVWKQCISVISLMGLAKPDKTMKIGDFLDGRKGDE